MSKPTIETCVKIVTGKVCLWFQVRFLNLKFEMIHINSELKPIARVGIPVQNKS